MASDKTEAVLVEVLTEELPPKALHGLAKAFAEQVVSEIAKHRLKDRDPKREIFATPRRIAVLVPDVCAQGSPSSHAVEGPVSSNVKAVEGFARKHKVTPESLERRQTDKGEIVVANFTMPGVRLDAVLPSIIEGALKKLPVPKVMRWGEGSVQFVRPIHGLVMLHGSAVVAGSVHGIPSSRNTLGHRFLSSGAIGIDDASRYAEILKKEGRVIAGFDERRAAIATGLGKAAGGADPIVNDALLDEIASLVEAPAVYAGDFDPDFLGVPEECLVLSMQQHQRYVPLRDQGTGKLLPRFLFVSNIETNDPSEIIHGNERVLRARLSDAKFFYDQDRKTPLKERVERLANVVYHNKLGSQLDRVNRVERLAVAIAEKLRANTKAAERAAHLCKADLLTEMVGEFPELQGVMGRYYALSDGEAPEVAKAIEEHYQPRFAGDDLPGSQIGSAVALADKLISLAGLFGIQQGPTGDKDPFALRRAALGIVRILVESKLDLHLDDLIARAFDEFQGLVSPTNIDVREFIYEFIFDRFSSYLKEQNYSTLEIDSVLSTHPQRLAVVPRQLEAVRAFSKLPEAESLAAANKRVVNILKQAQAKGESFDEVEGDVLKEAAEKALFDAITTAAQKATPLLATGDYTGYLKAFSVLKAPVDAFFDSIMVMTDDADLRRNRLALLAGLRKEMNRIADISKLAA